MQQYLVVRSTTGRRARGAQCAREVIPADYTWRCYPSLCAQRTQMPDGRNMTKGIGTSRRRASLRVSPLDPHPHLFRGRYDPRLGHFELDPLRVEVLQNQAGELLRQRLEQAVLVVC